MEDAFATVPQFLKIPIQMLIGDRVLDGISNHLSHQTGHFFGVYDGHGGSQVSYINKSCTLVLVLPATITLMSFCYLFIHHKLTYFLQVANYCRDRIHMALAEEVEFVKEGVVNGSNKDNCREQWRRAFTNCFLKVDDEVGGKANGDPVAPETVGSTAVVAIVCASHIIIANCGDSRAVLCRGKEAIALSVDHKVRNVFSSYLLLDIYMVAERRSLLRLSYFVLTNFNNMFSA